MEVDALISNVLAGIDADVAIAAYAVENCGRDLTVKDSPPADGLPGEGECPYLFVMESGKRAGSEDTEIKYSVCMGLCTYGADLETRADDAEVQSSAKHIRKLSVLIKDAVVAAMPSGWALRYDIAHDFTSLFPLFGSTIDLEFTEHWRTGVDPLGD